MSFLNLISIGEQLATISGAKSCVETMSFPGSLSPRAVGVLARHSRQDTRLMNDRQLINEIYFLLTSCETQGSKGVAILPCFLLIVAPIRDRFLSPREVNTTSEVWSGLRGPDPGGGGTTRSSSQHLNSERYNFRTDIRHDGDFQFFFSASRKDTLTAKISDVSSCTNEGKW